MTDLGMNPCLRNDRPAAEFMRHAMDTRLLMLSYLQLLFYARYLRNNKTGIKLLSLVSKQTINL